MERKCGSKMKTQKFMRKPNKFLEISLIKNMEAILHLQHQPNRLRFRPFKSYMSPLFLTI
jgi:hypothetical protein